MPSTSFSLYMCFIISFTLSVYDIPQLKSSPTPNTIWIEFFSTDPCQAGVSAGMHVL